MRAHHTYILVACFSFFGAAACDAEPVGPDPITLFAAGSCAILLSFLSYTRGAQSV